MPRAICHLSLLFSLQEQLQVQRPDVAALIDRHLAATLAGLVAPDALRIFGNHNKLSTHFYLDQDPTTWGRSVETMCRIRPEVSDPHRLDAPEQAFILGYISHLTADEAFREIVTAQLSGNPSWQKIVVGLWSLADELPVGRPHLAEKLKKISRQDIPSLVDPAPVERLLSVAALAFSSHSSWEREVLHRKHFGNRFGLKEDRADWERWRQIAADFFDTVRRQDFVEKAVALGLQEANRYWDRHYATNNGQ